jgi:hypothetical protein
MIDASDRSELSSVTDIWIGGEAVLIAEGTLYVP